MMFKLLHTIPVRYFFLAFNVTQWIIAVIMHIRYGNTTLDISASLIFAVLGTALYLIFTLGGTHIQHVDFRDDEIIVKDGTSHIQVTWADVRSLRVIPIIGLHRLQIEGRPGAVYFFPAKSDQVFTSVTKASEEHKEAKVEFMVSTPSRKAS